MQVLFKYYLSGYTFETNVFLPELISSEEKSKGSIIVNNQVNHQIPSEALSLRFYYNEQLNLSCLKSNQLGFIAIWDNKKIEYTPKVKDNDAYVRMIILGSMSMILSNCFGNVSLHAASIVINEKAILFCAKSGKGKSSLAAYFYSRGYTVLSDDVTNVYVDELGEIIALPSVPRIKLSKEALKRIGQSNDGLDIIPAPLITKYSLPVKEINQTSKYPVSHIYFPEFDENENRIIEVKGRSKLKELNKHVYRPNFESSLPIFQHRNKILFTVASTIEMKHFTRSSDENKMKESLDFIEKELNKTINKHTLS